MNPYLAAQHAVVVGLASSFALGILGALISVYFGD